MPKNTATRWSVKRQQGSYKRLRRSNPQGVGVLIEGDSWFSTPVASWEGPNLVGRLKKHKANGKHGFAIVSVANPGWELVDMIARDNVDLFYATSNLTKKQSYEVLLLSCGGNDILGKPLDNLLVDAAPGTAARRCLDRNQSDMEKAARCVVKCAELKRIVHDTLATKLKQFRKKTLKGLGLNDVRILIHGYDYPIPDGRPLRIMGKEFGNAWLRPKFEDHNIPQSYHEAIVKLLIDEFNSMLREVAKSQKNFHYLDLRGLLTHKKDWADEIHPHTKTGMKKIRDEMVSAIHDVHNGTVGSVIGGGRISTEYSCG